MADTASDLARRLAENVEAVCRHYLSNGRRAGGYWLAGDIQNSPGRSLYVRLRGPTAGRGAAGKWTDAATGERGDLLDLIAATQRLHGGNVLDEARHPIDRADASVAAADRDIERALRAMEMPSRACARRTNGTMSISQRINRVLKRPRRFRPGRCLDDVGQLIVALERVDPMLAGRETCYAAPGSAGVRALRRLRPGLIARSQNALVSLRQ